MHEKYTTEAFVIGSRSSREADKTLFIYTKDFGMIAGILSGVRNAGSKFKGFTDSGNKIFVTLVRGRSSWRITDVSADTDFKLSKPNLTSFLKILSLLKKLVQGEERNETLFETLENIFIYLNKRTHSPNSLEALECVGTIRLIAALGYGQTISNNIATSGPIHESDLLEASRQKAFLIRSINSSLSDSHLIGKDKV